MRTLIAAGVAGAVTFASTKADVTDVLNPAVVERFDTVQEQFLQAQSRGDVAAWTAVTEYFPPEESAENKTYASKAGIQLVRLYIEQGRLEDALTTIKSLEADPTTKDLYRVALIAEKCVLADAMGRQKMLTDARKKLQSTYASLQAKQPDKARMILDVIPENEANTLRASTNDTAD